MDPDGREFADLRRLAAGAVRAAEDDEPEGASAAQLAILSDRLGHRLPPALRSWLSVCRGAAIGPGGVFGERPDRPSLDMAGIRDLFPEWRTLGWLPVAGDGCGNYYVLTLDGIVGFVDAMSDPGRLERHVSADLLSLMTDLLAADQALPPCGQYPASLFR
jgi:SMI1 / KNR4 family (SUKH-1)